jgi:hypothetical protein
VVQSCTASPTRFMQVDGCDESVRAGPLSLRLTLLARPPIGTMVIVVHPGLGEHNREAGRGNTAKHTIEQH